MHPAVRPALAEPVGDEGYDEQRRYSFAAAPRPSSTPDATSRRRAYARRRTRRERDGDEVPVHEAVDRERRGEGEVQRPGADEQVQAIVVANAATTRSTTLAVKNADTPSETHAAARIAYIDRTGYSSHWPSLSTHGSR